MPPSPTSQTQSWSIYKGEILKSKFRSYNLDVMHSNHEDGAQVIGYPGHDYEDNAVGKNQKWHFTEKVAPKEDASLEGKSIISLLFCYRSS